MMYSRQVVAWLEHPAQIFNKYLGLGGLNGAVEERTTGLREPTDRWNQIIEQLVQESREAAAAVETEKDFDGGEIRGEVFGEDRSLTGHAAT